MQEGEFETSANGEIRFIALELMKLAQKSGKTFDEVAQDYIRNTERLQLLISGMASEGAGKSLREQTRQK